jgi:farnesyl-diphosphate farnesyltransferase
MNDAPDLDGDVLKDVSRSFYLSLRILPAPMRRPAGIAYLLARASDTIADSAIIPAEERMAFLDLHTCQIGGIAEATPWPQRLIDGTPDPKEKRLLENHVRILGTLRGIDSVSLSLIREVLSIIIGGQRLDLERFGNASSQNIIALPDEAALDDYTWRVAGCVGEFWTKLGFATLGDAFSEADRDRLLRLAAGYGSGLQLVNILRDLPADLRAGRCYLPVANPRDEPELMAAFHGWREIALQRIGLGLEYSNALRSKRLRIASSLPASIGRETLVLLGNASFYDLGKGIRIPRRRVYSLLLSAFLRG